ncbi:CalY family protein [Pseudogracilibacillus sp. SE30717A]|uniref:CalY family protein n=1 Tax=Pseudogracilibacillus sp. SE30717A TaxID=3098293 RepID=UPI00300E381B
MNIKKQVTMGIMSAALGIMLIVGGTFAFFSDSVTSNNTFAAGTLELGIDKPQLINIKNIKPGDSMIRDFELQNNGTLDIQKVVLETDYKVIDANGNNTEDFGDHILVEFLYNVNNFDEVIFKTTLAELKNMSPEAINKNIFYPELGDEGLPAGETHDFIVKFVFIENGKDQNQFQGDALELEWTFTAYQKDGEPK